MTVRLRFLVAPTGFFAIVPLSLRPLWSFDFFCVPRRTDFDVGDEGRFGAGRVTRAFGGRPLFFGRRVSGVGGREGPGMGWRQCECSPPFAMADIVPAGFFDLLASKARLLPSMLGGTVSFIFREGRAGFEGGGVGAEIGVDAEVDLAYCRLSSAMERGADDLGLLSQVHSPSQTGHMSLSSSSS